MRLLPKKFLIKALIMLFLIIILQGNLELRWKKKKKKRKKASISTNCLFWITNWYNWFEGSRLRQRVFLKVYLFDSVAISRIPLGDEIKQFKAFSSFCPDTLTKMWTHLAIGRGASYLSINETNFFKETQKIYLSTSQH